MSHYFSAPPRIRGFTIIELLIVIVVIGILVSVVTISWSGAQARSRDSKRLADAKAIEAALESYRSNNNDYPAAVATPASQLAGAATGGWETSGAAQPGTFLSAIKPYGFTSGVPVDPSNDTLNNVGKTYRYKTYAAGTNGCDSSLGDYYVFVVNDLETVNGISPQSPGFSCAGNDWQTYGDYVFGHFVNE